MQHRQHFSQNHQSVYSRSRDVKTGDCCVSGQDKQQTSATATESVDELYHIGRSRSSYSSLSFGHSIWWSPMPW